MASYHPRKFQDSISNFREIRSNPSDIGAARGAGSVISLCFTNRWFCMASVGTPLSVLFVRVSLGREFEKETELRIPKIMNGCRISHFFTPFDGKRSDVTSIPTANWDSRIKFSSENSRESSETSQIWRSVNLIHQIAPRDKKIT